MKKSFYDSKPNVFERYSINSTLIRYNIEEISTIVENEEKVVWQCDTIIVESIDKSSIVEKLIRKVYSLNDELAILRQRDSKQEEFNDYNEYVENCKVIADDILIDYNKIN